ncbi:hypothetical protein CDEST_08510 [Colletotrichum destructivum]|uniref:BZIP domain-containing protein n=1 Tax=Colletotrichum destructivum TaxID=34406 RepID=A0AAX4IJ87_9PEZI|nr:hypothetical protein CDEST_08510 [Colletotrichum destructivum]
MEAEKERSRIRDNQRRSRARKKEYVLEIEQKLRQCHSKGVEASAEVQQAARHVANENHKLRQLLHTLGLVDEQIEQYIQAGTLNSLAVANQPVLHESSSVQQGQAAATLERLLAPRRPPCLQEHELFAPANQPTTPNRNSMYQASEDSSIEDYETPEDGIQQICGLVSTSSSNLNPRPTSYPRPETLPSNGYGGHRSSQESIEWANANHGQEVNDIPLNPPRYGTNQTFAYRSFFPAANPPTAPLPLACCGPPTTSYAVYHTSHHQSPVFFASQLESIVKNNPGPFPIADTKSSAEERAPQQAVVDPYAWVPTASFHRTDLDRRLG